MADKKCIFMHSEGHGGSGFRKGTDLVLNAFQQLSYRYKDVMLCMHSQCSETEHSQLHNRRIDGMIVNKADLAEPIDMYRAPQYCKVYSGSTEMFSGYLFGLSTDNCIVGVDEHSGVQVLFNISSGSTGDSQFQVRDE